MFGQFATITSKDASIQKKQAELDQFFYRQQKYQQDSLITSAKITVQPNETTMPTPQLNPNPARAYQRVTYIFGKVAQQMTAQEIIQVIQMLEGEIKSLRSLETQSKRVTKEIKKREANIKRITTYLDKRTY